MTETHGTRLTIPIADATGGSRQIVVRETFDEVLDRIANPQGQATSALEHRQRSLYTRLDNRRVFIPPQAVALVEEAVEDEDV